MGITTIVLCTEYIDKLIKSDQELNKFLTVNRIKCESLFDTELLISESRFLIKNSEKYKILRDELRIKSLKKSDTIKRISDDEGKILLICNNMNKMSPIIYLMIENLRDGISLEEEKERLNLIYIEKSREHISDVHADKIIEYYNKLRS